MEIRWAIALIQNISIDNRSNYEYLYGMKFFCVLVPFIFSIFGCTKPDIQKEILPTQKVNGKTFVGKPTHIKSESGCEGCGEPGYAKFGMDNQLEFTYPGSDEIDSGTFIQNNREIMISLQCEQKSLRFVLSPDYLTIESEDKTMLLKDNKFQW
jgi:hypothetical protein